MQEYPCQPVTGIVAAVVPETLSFVPDSTQLELPIEQRSGTKMGLPGTILQGMGSTAFLIETLTVLQDATICMLEAQLVWSNVISK